MYYWLLNVFEMIEWTACVRTVDAGQSKVLGVGAVLHVIYHWRA